MKSYRLLLITAVVALVIGFVLGWTISNRKGSSKQDQVVARLKVERDSLLRAVDAREVVVQAWKDSIAVRDQRVARADSVTARLTKQVDDYAHSLAVFRGTSDDLHRELNRLIHSGPAAAGATGPGASSHLP